jgi:ferredoxin/flavodoxin
MQQAKTHLIYFSATGTTKKLVQTFGEALGKDCASLDLLRHPLTQELAFSPDEAVVVGVPVYSGRAAPIALESIEHMRGSSTPAAILVAYGNRAYDDALLELKDCLEERGFVVAAAGAFVARHAVFPRYAIGRPDESDLAILRALAGKFAEKIADASRLKPGSLEVNGKRPYRKPVDMTLYPRANDSCIGCGACAALCPAKVINPENPRAKPAKGCLSCAACIHVCPQHARSFGGFVYTFFDVVFDFIFRTLFFWRKNERKEPEIFV